MREQASKEPDPEATAAETTAPRYLLLLVTVSLGVSLAPLNSTMVAVALPDIRADFDVSHTMVAWLVSFYLIAMAVAQPIGGRLGDQIGRTRAIRGGLVVFLALSLAAAASPNFAVLVVLRTLQAVVGAAVMPNGMAMLRESVPSERLGRANGITSSMIGLAAAVGPIIGAAALVAGSWRLLFVVNLPIVLAALMTLALLDRKETAERRAISLDFRGALILAAGLGALTQGFAWTRAGEAVLAGFAFAAVVLLAWLLAVYQRGATVQVAEWRLLRMRTYFGATSYVLMSNLVMYTTLIAVPFFLREVQGKSVESAGALLAVMSGVMMVVAPFSGMLSDRFGRRPLAMTGGVLQLGAVLLLLAGFSEGLSTWYLALCLLLMGLSIGVGSGPASTAALEAVPVNVVGAAAGTSSMMRYFGSIIGVGLLGAVLNSGEATPDVALFQGFFAFLAVLSCGVIAASALIHVRVVAYPPAAARAGRGAAEATAARAPER